MVETRVIINREKFRACEKGRESEYDGGKNQSKRKEDNEKMTEIFCEREETTESEKSKEYCVKSKNQILYLEKIW